VPRGAVAPLAGPVDAPERYCSAYARQAPPKRRFNAHIVIDSECTVIEGSSSDEFEAVPSLPAPGPPYGEVGLIRARAPHDQDEGPEESWDGFEEIRVAIATERGVFVEERGIEIADWLPYSTVTLRKLTTADIVAGGEPELRIELELFIGADEGIPEQYQVVELVCGFGPSGALACGRFESRVEELTPPASPVRARDLRALVLP